jgi:hypothetical protein
VYAYSDVLLTEVGAREREAWQAAEEEGRLRSEQRADRERQAQPVAEQGMPTEAAERASDRAVATVERPAVAKEVRTPDRPRRYGRLGDGARIAPGSRGHHIELPLQLRGPRSLVALAHATLEDIGIAFDMERPEPADLAPALIALALAIGIGVAVAFIV